jgi:hypothetical protein
MVHAREGSGPEPSFHVCKTRLVESDDAVTDGGTWRPRAARDSSLKVALTRNQRLHTQETLRLTTEQRRVIWSTSRVSEEAKTVEEVNWVRVG